MKPTKLFLALAVAVLLGACKQKESVVANIDGWGNDSIIALHVVYGDNGYASEITDTILAVNGKFSYTFPENTYNNLHRGVFFRLCDIPVRGAKRIDVDLVGDEKVKVKGKAYEEYVEYVVKGNTVLSGYNNLHNELIEYLIARDKNEDELEAHLGTPEVDKYFAKRRELNVPIRDVKRQHLLDHPDSESSVLLLSDLPLDSFYLYTHLTERVRNGVLKVFFDDKMKRYNQYQAYLEAEKKNLVDKPAPDFTLTDAKGNEFTLSECTLHVLFKVLWVFGFGDACSGEFGKHIEHQFLIGHIIPQILLLQTLVLLILLGCLTCPCLVDDIGECGILHAFFHIM